MRQWILGACVILLCVSTTPETSAASGFASFDPAGGGSGYPPAANGTEKDRPQVRAYALNGDPITLDGHLDDIAWADAETATGFRVWDPTRGASPSEETVFKVAYDENAFYIAVACLEADSENITTQLCRRDQMTGSDQISLYVDPMYDRNTAYNFRVNPSGAQEDRYVYNDGSMDTSWDGVWEVETTRDAGGWYAEFRIPFSCIRYRHSGNMTWGFQLYRYMHGRGEDTAWAIWDAETRGFVSRFGTVTDIRGVRPRRQLEILPYVVQQSTDPSAGGDGDDLDHFQNFGADLKMAVTSDLTLNAAFQPDFGQVEADPAVLNLSPFETWYEEKRPFFLEGIQFYQHPYFNMFYSRRIGTGSENSRIRFAGKLTGKTSGGVSVASLYAVTDVTEDGQAHNFMKGGEQQTHYLLGRFSKEFSEGRHRIGFMQSAVYKPEDRDAFGDFETRDAWTTGLDFDLNFHDRDYNISGSAVGSIIDPARLASDPSVTHDKTYGTGGSLQIRKLGGRLYGGWTGNWLTDKLDINDIGYLEMPDRLENGIWLTYRRLSDSRESLLLNYNTQIEYWRKCLYGAGEGMDIDRGEVAWSYGKGHLRYNVVEWDGWGKFRNYWEGWFGVNVRSKQTDRWATEDYEDHRGPLIELPGQMFTWWGINTDTRKPLVWTHVGNHLRRGSGTRSTYIGFETRWLACPSMIYYLEIGFDKTLDDAQHIENFANPGGGIGGVSWVFGELDQRTVDITFRGSLLFSRHLSLELYAQPYLSVGDYRNPRELAKPDSDEWTPYTAEDFDVDDYDFRYSSVNLNTVLRWEYRPGSTFYLVWKQGRCIDENRGDALDAGHRFNNALRGDHLFRAEPENVILAKLSYWFAR